MPIRYGRMLVSPFTFFRGAAYLMAADLADAPRTGLEVQLCGDAHLSNFGAFAAPDRRLVFSINDFDETLPGPFEWDVKRLVASFAVAGRDRGFDAQAAAAINATVDARLPRRRWRDFAGDAATSTSGTRASTSTRSLASSSCRRARSRSSASSATSRRRGRRTACGRSRSSTHVVDGEPRIVGDPPLIVPIEDLVPAREQDGSSRSSCTAMIRSYRQTLPRDRRRLLERFRYVHAARKVVGVGSVGTRAWIVLMLGRDEGDPLFLQFKEAEASVLEPFLGKSAFAHHGQRVVEGQRLMQAASDIMLGWVRITDVDGVGPRLLHPPALGLRRDRRDIEMMSPRMLTIYAKVCGWALAKAMPAPATRSRSRAYLGGGDAFDRALAAFAESYADQNERDYQALQGRSGIRPRASRNGRLTVPSSRAPNERRR